MEKLSYCRILFCYIPKKKKKKDSYSWWILKKRLTAFLGRSFKKKLWNCLTLVQTLEDAWIRFVSMPVHVFRLMAIVFVGLVEVEGLGWGINYHPI